VHQPPLGVEHGHPGGLPVAPGEVHTDEVHGFTLTRRQDVGP